MVRYKRISENESIYKVYGDVYLQCGIMTYITTGIYNRTLHDAVVTFRVCVSVSSEI